MMSNNDNDERTWAPGFLRLVTIERYNDIKNLELGDEYDLCDHIVSRDERLDGYYITWRGVKYWRDNVADVFHLVLDNTLPGY